MALTHAERGRLGGRARAAKQTPEQRVEHARQAGQASARTRYSLDAYVAALVRRAPELTAGQVDQLRQVIAAAPAGGASR